MSTAPTTPTLLARLDGAVAMFGGLRPAARAARIDAANLAKYLKCGEGLSSESLRRLEKALGSPGGEPNQSHVRSIKPARINWQVGYALSWHFPNGAEIARPTWSGLGWERIRKTLPRDQAPEIYGFRNPPNGRLVLIAPANSLLPRDLFGPVCEGLRWHGGEPERSELRIDDIEPWINGQVTVEAFDAAWPTDLYNPTAEDLLNQVRRLNLSWAEAIRRVSYNRLDRPTRAEPDRSKKSLDASSKVEAL